jgi:hypothetical protein
LAKKSRSYLPDEDEDSAPEPDEPIEKPAEPPPEKPAEPPPAAPEQPLEPEQAKQLLYAGHRLHYVGESKDAWFTSTHHRDERVVCKPLTPEAEKEIFSKPVALAE